ncbi:hypothetical protein F66182_1480 [Fusarium sp. NRRL 66182]|nr:hypothetical protein F66182_1480 [Fusarium sp. NRRL 66182]
MAPVMLVTFENASQSTTPAVLKLYDRRFGTHLRILNGKYAPCTTQDEAKFQLFIGQGKMSSFLQELKEENENSLIPPTASDFYDDSADATAKYEAALWHEANQHFHNETEAYTHLKELQGRLIPRVYAHVRLDKVAGERIQPDAKDYLNVYGILMQLVEGFDLWDMPTSLLAPSDRLRWPNIIQSAVDAAHEVNKRGIILQDSGPRNVVVDQASQMPFLIDLAQCLFKDKLFDLWENLSLEDEDEDGEEWDPEIEYWDRVRSHNNPASIGSVMAKLLLQEYNLDVDIKYPDYDKMIAESKRCLLDAKDVKL